MVYSLISSLFQAKRASPHKEPHAGDLFSFETSPFDPETNTAPTGRYGAMKILGRIPSKFIEGHSLAYAVLDGVFQRPPTKADLKSCKILRQVRFQFKNRPAILRLLPDAEQVPDHFAFLGSAKITKEDLKLANQHEGYGVFDFSGISVEGEWRWANDRTALIAEQEQREKRNALNAAKLQLRYEERLKALSIDQLMSEPIFPEWDNRTQVLKTEFITAVRQHVTTAFASMRGLDPKPKRAQVRKLLRNLVSEMRDDDRIGGLYWDTEERGDMSLLLEEICYACKQKHLVNELEDWTNW